MVHEIDSDNYETIKKDIGLKSQSTSQLNQTTTITNHNLLWGD